MRQLSTRTNIFYDRDKEYILEKKEAPIEPVVDWIRKHL